MAGKDVAAKATAAQQPKSVARRLWRLACAVLYMLRRGVLPSGRKLAMDLSLLLRRGKIASKALGGLLNFHHHHHAASFSVTAASGSSSSFSCRALDPAVAVHEPWRSRREVEFSCSNTPSSASAGGFFGSSKRRGGHRRHRDDEAAGYYGSNDAADVARVFEMLNDGAGHVFDDDALALAMPSPALWTSSASAARQLRITDSPFSATDSDAAGEQQQVDRKADEFIRRFYEQLREQKSVAATPDYHGYAASSYSGCSPQPVAAGIA